MKYSLLKIVLGLLLCGCTVNAVRIKTVVTPPEEQPTAVLTSTALVRKPKVVVSPVVPIVIKSVIKPACDAYKPPAVPKPFKINLKELKEAKSPSEINTIALKAVAILHKQLENYDILQKRSYADYLKRCMNN